MREDQRSGLDATVTARALLDRMRRAHPTFGSFEAAELEFWWSRERSTDRLPQLFWFDETDQPVAAMIVTDFGDGSSLLYEDPTVVFIFLPDAVPATVDLVVARGMAHLDGHGFTTVELEVDPNDRWLTHRLEAHGFETKGSGLAECWLDVVDRPAVSPMNDGYRLSDRSLLTDRPHHLVRPDGFDVTARLADLSLYRPELDLVVLGPDDDVAGYGMFWHNPATNVGVVEPMRTLDAHQRNGVARHVLTAGIERLAAAGSARVSITVNPDSTAPSQLYADVGFVPHRHTVVMARSI